jgi:hypothetical protein
MHNDRGEAKPDEDGLDSSGAAVELEYGNNEVGRSDAAQEITE